MRVGDGERYTSVLDRETRLLQYEGPAGRIVRMARHLEDARFRIEQATRELMALQAALQVATNYEYAREVVLAEREQERAWTSS